jgi:hypothetical protein
MRGVCLLAFIAAAAVAAQPTGPTGPTGAVRRDAPAHRTRPHAFVGEVVTVNSAAGTFTGREALRDGSPKTTTFEVDAKTRIVRGKDSCTIGDLRPFDHVTVKYAEENGGRHRAMTVTVTPALIGADPRPADSPAPR